MKKRTILLMAAALSIGCFVACDGDEKAQLQGLNDFSYLVGYRVQLPAPSISAEIGENLDYTVTVTKPSGNAQSVQKTQDGYAFTAETAGAYSIEYTVVNAEGEAFTKTIVMTATEDMQKPVLGELSSALSGLSIGDELAVPTVAATDDSLLSPYNGTLSYVVKLTAPSGAEAFVYPEESVQLNEHGEYALSYTATDRAGNASEEKTVQFTVASKGNAAYTVEHYLENLDGTYTLASAATEQLERMIGSIATAEKEEFEHHTLDVGNAQSVTQAAVKEDGSTVLKLHYALKKYTVSFHTDGGSKVESQLVKYGGAATEPNAPEKDGASFESWMRNSVPFDFSTPILGDTSVYAGYAENDRYGKVLGNGSGDGWGTYANTTYCWATVFNKNAQDETDENNTVMAMTVTAGNADATGASSYTYSVAELSNIISSKRYFGYRVYSPKDGPFIQTEFTFQSGSKKFITRVLKGWNEIVVDLESAIGGKISEENPLKTLALGVFGDTEWVTAGTSEYTFCFDDIYATNYDVSNTVDFDSVGDLQRFTSVGGTLYAQRKYKFPDCCGGALTVETVDGETAMKMRPTYATGQIDFQTYSGALFNQSLAEYKTLEVRVRLDSEAADLTVSLGGVSATVSGATQAEQWITLTLDLTKIENIASVGALSIKLVNGGSVAASFAVDYIKFVK